MNTQKENLRRCMRLYQDFINYNKSQIKYLVEEAGYIEEESPDIIIAKQVIEWYKKQIRECQIELEVLFSRR